MSIARAPAPMESMEIRTPTTQVVPMIVDKTPGPGKDPIAASAALIAEASDTQWVLTAITAVIAWLSFKTKLHPLWLLAAGSLIGLTGFGQF